MLESVLKASCLPLSFLLFVPAVLLLLGPPPAAEAAHEFTVYRMQQYELGGQPYGERLHGPAGLGSACAGPWSSGRANPGSGSLQLRRGPGKNPDAGEEPSVGREAAGGPGRAAQPRGGCRRARRALGRCSQARARVRTQTHGRTQAGTIWLSFTAQPQHKQEGAESSHMVT